MESKIERGVDAAVPPLYYEIYYVRIANSWFMASTLHMGLSWSCPTRDSYYDIISGLHARKIKLWLDEFDQFLESRRKC